MSVQTQIDRISGAVSDALAALTDKGVTVPDGTTVDGLAALIAAIEAGGGAYKIGTFVLAEENYSPCIPIEDAKSDDGLLPKFAAAWLTSPLEIRLSTTTGWKIGPAILIFNDDSRTYPERGYGARYGEMYSWSTNNLNASFPYTTSFTYVNQTGIALGLSGSSDAKYPAGEEIKYICVW